MNGNHIYSPMSSSGRSYIDLPSYPSDYDTSNSSAAATAGPAAGAMLSVDFSAPLAGEQRAERIKQMSMIHPAIGRTRHVQEVLCKVQTSLRRMPGVSSNESAEIIVQLKEVGQVISKEMGQLVTDLMTSRLDLTDNNHAVMRMSVESNLNKAAIDHKDQAISTLQEQVYTEGEKREAAESLSKTLKEELHDVSEKCKKLQDKKSRGESHGSRADREKIKGFEDKIKHLEDQVNNRRSLWVMKHPSPESISRAIESLAESVPKNDLITKSFDSLRIANKSSNKDNRDNTGTLDRDISAPLHKLPSLNRSVSSFHSSERPVTATLTGFSPIQAGPPRAPSSQSHHRGLQSAWDSGPNLGSARTVSTGNQLCISPFSQRNNNNHSRRGFYNQSKYRPNVPDFQTNSIFSPRNIGPERPSTAFGHSSSNYGGGGPDQYSGQMQLASAGGGGGRPYGYDSYSNSSNALVGRSFHSPALIHMTERAVTEWSRQTSDFYASIRSFVDRHAAQPLPGPPDTLLGDYPIWGILIRTYLPLSSEEARSYLHLHLREGTSKLCLVTRVVIDYVVNLVWVPHAWRGFDDESSRKIDELVNDLAKTHGQQSSVRQPLLDRQAAIIGSILDKVDPGSEFYRFKIEQIAGSILASIQPLLNSTTSANEAFPDVMSVAESAWELSSRILTSRLTFDFRFPEIGSRFSSQSMTPIWPAELDPSELQARHWRVALVTTPVITCRNDTGTNISAHSVAHADVICMQ